MTDFDNSKCKWAYKQGVCGFRVPDSTDECRGKCLLYEEEGEEMLKVIEGMGQDAEVVTNASGGKQSKAPMAMHLVDADYLKSVFNDKLQQLNFSDIKPIDLENKYYAVINIATFMESGIKGFLLTAMYHLCNDVALQVINVAKILQYGAERYQPNNWRLIPEEDHLNHALSHIFADLAGDTQDDHINHALCRLMMAYATEKSENFEYNKYVNKNS